MPCCDVFNRGVCLVRRQSYFGTLDAKLVAPEQRHGKPVWSVKKVAVYQAGYAITAGPSGGEKESWITGVSVVSLA